MLHKPVKIKPYMRYMRSKIILAYIDIRTTTT